MNMKKRTVWKQGKSDAISLPPDWVRYHKPKEVEMYWNNGAIVIIVKKTSAAVKKRLIAALEGS